MYQVSDLKESEASPTSFRPRTKYGINCGRTRSAMFSSRQAQPQRSSSICGDFGDSGFRVKPGMTASLRHYRYDRTLAASADLRRSRRRLRGGPMAIIGVVCLVRHHSSPDVASRTPSLVCFPEAVQKGTQTED